MQQAIMKYASQPKVTERSHVPVTQIKPPLFYVCHFAQFNYTRAESLGYSTYEDFVLGKVNGSDKATWIGKSRNQTYNKTVKSLFNDDYSDLDTGLTSTKIVFIHPYGFCTQMTMTNLTMVEQEVRSKHSVSIVIQDPYNSNNLKIEGELGEIEKLDAEKGKNEYLQNKMFYKLHDESVYDGDKCTDYSKLNMSFGQCLEKEVKNKLIKLYDCIPQWFPGNMKKCSASSQPITDEAKDYISKISSSNNIVTACKPSCKKLELQLKRIGKSDHPTMAIFDIKHHQEVEVHKTIYAYDIFNLIVELGSSLGLWMGMSAVGLLDILIESWASLQQVLATKIRNQTTRDH